MPPDRDALCRRAAPAGAVLDEIDLGAGRCDLQTEALQLVIPQEASIACRPSPASTVRLLMVIAGMGWLR